jgi:serine/threonine protein kinase/tetratricopeptide (TPR) repeat protein
MANKDWQQIETLFHAALPLDAGERPAFLAQACAGNEWLQLEVESLIRAFEGSNGFIDQPAFGLGIEVMQAGSSSSMSGQTVGGYKVLKRLGKGGMGEVYLAEDTRLGRNVALKFLSSEFVGDNWAKRQLVKEAQSVAMLDHPNICSIYGIEQAGDHSFLIMQYVEGQMLSDLIREELMDPDRVVTYAQQIVSALAEAHAHGIIHRDVKPQNIMVKNNGLLKVLDFGLAKLVQQEQGLNDNASRSSQLGFIPGTVSYMSPEQLRGEKLDYRSDVFSFGTVLFEMLSTKNPFARNNKAETISAILTGQVPALKHDNTTILRELERIARKCLQNDKSERFQSANELLIELESCKHKFLKEGDRTSSFVVRATAALVFLLLLVAVTRYAVNYVTRPHTIAILPIANKTGDASLDYLGEGLTESLINKLSGPSRLRVKAFSMVSGYKGETDPQRIARDLSVDHVVVGNIRGTRNALTLEITMVEAEDGSQRWAKSYPVEANASVGILDDISKQVSSSLLFWSGGNEERTARRQVNPEARNEYMLGRYYWRNRDNDHTLKAAIDHFNAAIRLDPNYAEAHTGLADCYALGNVVSYPDMGMDTREAMSRAARAAKDAIDLDENLGEAYTSRAFVELKFQRDWQAAEKDFKRSIDLKPDYALAFFGYSNLLTIEGKQSEAIAMSQTARELDPFSPVTALNYCRSFYYARRDDEALACYDKLVKDNPDYTNGQYGRGLMYLKRGLNHDAIIALETLYNKNERGTAAALGYAYGISGKESAAREVLAEMQRLDRQSHLPAQEFALVYLGLGDKDNAFIWLKKAVDDHFAPTSYLAVDPIYDSIRSDPRFTELVKSLNLAPSN